MLSFRFHLVSLVAVFLALAIGVIMGSTVIDRALVDTLEDQQQSLRSDLDDITADNEALRQELSDLRRSSDDLAGEGAERLLAGTLDGVPVLTVAVRGVDPEVLDQLGALLSTAGAQDQGTLWLTDRLALADGEQDDLAAALGAARTKPVDALRADAVAAVAAAVRAAVEDEAGDPGTLTGGDPVDGGLGDGGTGDGDDGEAVDAGAVDPEADGTAPGDDPSLEELRALRDAGFVEYDPPEGGADDLSSLASPGTLVVLVSGPGAGVADDRLAAPLAGALVRGGVDPPVALLAAEPGADPAEVGDAPGDAAGAGPGVVAVLRGSSVANRLSTVDNLDDFAGRVAAVVALQDLPDGRRGHYGDGPGAQRLIPAPAG